MPKRDKIHSVVRQALIKAGWTITDDPYVISYGERFLFVDWAAAEGIAQMDRKVRLSEQI